MHTVNITRIDNWGSSFVRSDLLESAIYWSIYIYIQQGINISNPSIVDDVITEDQYTF